nr:MAG TPA: hypothetical protein [Bacteriophage sp.]
MIMYLKDFLKLVANRDKVWIVLNDLDESNGIFNSLAVDLKKKLESLFRLSVVNFENASMMVRLDYSNAYNDFIEIIFNEKGFVINTEFIYEIDKSEFEKLREAIKIIEKFWNS